MSLEGLINQANEYYLDEDKAVIYKKPTPIGLEKVDYKKGEIKKAHFQAKSTFDSSQTVQIDVRIDPHKAVLRESIF